MMRQIARRAAELVMTPQQMLLYQALSVAALKTQACNTYGCIDSGL